MFDPDIKINLESALGPYLSERNIDLIELRLNRYRTMLTVDVLVDIDGGGISIDQCADINKFLNHEIEQNGWIEGDYQVEVSSPGIDRPLKTYKDFKRAIGRPVAVYLNLNDLGLKLEYRGRLQSVEEHQIVIDQVPTSADAFGKNNKGIISKGVVTIPMGVVQKGMQII